MDPSPLSRAYRHRRRVEAPSEFVPLAVSRDDIFGFVRDELDVQYIVRYSIDNGAFDQ